MKLGSLQSGDRYNISNEQDPLQLSENSDAIDESEAILYYTAMCEQLKNTLSAFNVLDTSLKTIKDNKAKYT